MYSFTLDKENISRQSINKIYSLCLLCDGRHRLHGVEQLALLLRVLDVGVDEQGVHLAVDVLDGDLEL